MAPLINAADVVRKGSAGVDKVFAGTVQVWPAASSAPTYGGKGGTWSAGGETLTITPPEGAASGDLVILVASSDTSASWTPVVSGFTAALTSFAAGNMHTHVLTKVWTSGNIVITSSPSASAVAYWWRGASGVANVGSPAVRSSSSTSITAPSITTTTARTVLALFGDRSVAASSGEADTALTVTWGTVLDNYQGNTTLSSGLGIAGHWLVALRQSVAGVTGVNTATMVDASGNGWGLQLALVDA